MGAELFRVDVKDGAAGRVTKLGTTGPLEFPDALRAFEGGFRTVEGRGALSRVTVSGDVAKIEPLRHVAGPTGDTVLGDVIRVADDQLGLMSRPADAGRDAPSFHLRSPDAE